MKLKPIVIGDEPLLIDKLWVRIFALGLFIITMSVVGYIVWRNL